MSNPSHNPDEMLCILFVLGTFVVHCIANLWLIFVALRTGIGGLLALFPWPIPFLRPLWAIHHWDKARRPYKICNFTLGAFWVAIFFSSSVFINPTQAAFGDMPKVLDFTRFLVLFTAFGLIYLWANFEVMENHANSDSWFYAVIPGYSLIWMLMHPEMIREIPAGALFIAVVILIVWLAFPHLELPAFLENLATP